MNDETCKNEGCYMSWRYYNYKPSTPIKVDNGIKAKSRSGDIGDTWWSKRWVKVLESFGWSNRLQRGRRYARSGQVLDFNLSPGKITARVQGSVKKPYSVNITIKPFKMQEWEKITDVMAQKALFAAKLLAGEMPQNIEDAFTVAGVSLFPKSAKDLKTHCSCPDHANPCKHIAAVYYIVAEEFDRDPFMLFKLRGQTQKEITMSLRKKRSAKTESQKNAEKSSEHEINEQEEDSIFSIDDFWTGKEMDSFHVDISPPEVSAAIIKRLGTPYFWDHEEDFIKIMSEYYDHISTRAIKEAYGEDSRLEESKKHPSKTHSLEKNHESKIPEPPEQDVRLQEIFNRETGKNAIWRGKETKGYLEWKKQYLIHEKNK